LLFSFFLSSKGYFGTTQKEHSKNFKKLFFYVLELNSIFKNFSLAKETLYKEFVKARNSDWQFYLSLYLFIVLNLLKRNSQ
jgi:hypothetical protein